MSRIPDNAARIRRVTLTLTTLFAAIISACGGGSGGGAAAVTEAAAAIGGANGAGVAADGSGTFALSGAGAVGGGGAPDANGNPAAASTGLVDANGSLTVSATGAAAPTAQWIKITDEWGSFNTTGTQRVRFGASPNWTEKSITGSGTCTNAFFGGDPAVGRSKTCEVFGSVVQAASVSAAVDGLVAAAAAMPFIDATRIPLGSAGKSGDIVRPTTEVAQPSDSGDFRTSCEYSHMAYDDPIVYPGQPGKSHLHTFFGNTLTDASSTALSIATTGNSTCRGGTVNRTAYWVPSLIDTADGTPVKPLTGNFYYKTGYNNIPKASFRALPQGLRMIAGDPKNATPSGSFGFKCITPSGVETMSGKSIQNCAVGDILIAEVWFPQCWDGVNLDSPDHKSHMSYLTSALVCPSTHPVAVPQITFNIEFQVATRDQALRWRLSSDAYDSKVAGGYSMHGDWFNGWKKDIMDAWVRGCNQASRDCHAHLLGDGRMIDY
jgi:hypothetical protein